ncbi:cAMP-binding domain of CRP or a regulatory subunit of cAMP-dependent protein kinases [Chitinophaga sp. YR573]|jgi:CRP-like cAMP-binding protein|uniref:Crp/Fnr family transcriptional regulator n=1 Tax=Chitinophaga sp. YR573 TaxID=1881040 RepID=UPI0008C766CB|nr:Crp/Fnr family transcriptional regulator [Chitinophaga sp. YR573]SEV90910.1 cAMP-binding domain of CRP or a regulatory subunit of cAMP-dependent protein kinases [Chitinophaga sp. YR573]
MYEQLTKYIQDNIPATEKELELILSYFKPLTIKKNELLGGQRMFFVVKGCLRIFFIQEDGQDITRYLAFENNFATALVSFISQEPSLEFIQTLENTELLYISRRDFHHLLDTIPLWDKFYRHYLEHAYVTNTNRLMSFITMDAIERYRILLKENPIIVQRLPNKIVASYLNISQETLSRIKSKKRPS